MFGIGLLVIVAIIVAVVWSSRRDHDELGTPVQPGAPARRGAAGSGLRAALDRWLAADLLTADQASAIEAYEAALATRPAPPQRHLEPSTPRRIPVVAEALGYLGGMLSAAGLGLIVGRNWSGLGAGGQLALSGLLAAALFGGGLLVHEEADSALARLRWFLWTASTAAAGLFAAVLVQEILSEPAAETIVLVTAAAVLVESAALWAGRPRPLQQLGTLVALGVVAGTAASLTGVEGLIGPAIWVVGAAELAVGIRRRLSFPDLTVLIGALTVVVGGIATGAAVSTVGLPFSVATALGLLALAVVPRPASRVEVAILGAVGAVALLESAPATIGYYAERAGVATGLVTWAVGAAILAVGLRRLVHTPTLAMGLGSLGLLVGAAVTAAQVSGLGPLFMLVTALALVALGTVPGGVVLSVFGSVGLLVSVPWCISHFFPGEGRVPVLILASGVLIIGVAVLLTRLAPRLRHELRSDSEPLSSGDI